MSKPLISVIIPAWNTAVYLPDTLQSVADQSFHNFEVIMVDDGSTDGSFEIMQAWAGRDPRFKAIRQAFNQGVVAARNAALNIAEGQYVAMLDGDDLWAPEALALRLDAAQTFPDAAVIATDFTWFEGSIIPNAKGRITMGPKACALFAEAYATGRSVCLHNAFDAVAEHHFAWTGATLVRREEMANVGNFDTNFQGPEDTLLWLQLANKGAFVFVPMITAHYRQRPGSLAHCKYGPKEFHYLKVLDYLLCKPAFTARRKKLLELISLNCTVCVIYFRRERRWRLAIDHAQRSIRLDPFITYHWRNLVAALLRR